MASPTTLESLPTLVAHQGKQVHRGRPRGFRSFEDMTPTHPLFSPSVPSSSSHLLSDRCMPEEAQPRELFTVGEMEEEDAPEFMLDIGSDLEDNGPIVCHLCLCIGHFQATCPVRQCPHCLQYGRHTSCPKQRKQRRSKHQPRRHPSSSTTMATPPPASSEQRVSSRVWAEKCNSHGKSQGFESFGSNRKYKDIHRMRKKHVKAEEARRNERWKHKPQPQGSPTSCSTRPHSPPQVRQWRSSGTRRSLLRHPT